MGRLLPPCTNACPVHTDVRGYVAAIARRDYKEAYRLIRANNPFPAVCAWICHHPCEGACRRAAVDSPLSIRDLKRFAVEAAGPLRSVMPRARETGKRVAVVGGGPAGLTAAFDLVRLGHRAVVYERHRSPGGHFLSSLPTYRLPREMLRRDVEEIIAAGVEVRTGVRVGEDVTLKRLREEYDAVVVATGLWASRGLDLPGHDRPGVYAALGFLEKVNAGQPPPVGPRVAVIGGGNVALDVARTALRLGAEEVVVVCLESREQMPAHGREIDEALAEGVRLLPGCGPLEVVVGGGAITGLAVEKVISIFDADGKFNPLLEPGSRQTLPCETVILAVGQAPDLSFLDGFRPEAAAGGPVVAGRELFDLRASGVFACGEVATGPGSAIAAVASGHRAAQAVDKYLKGEEPCSGDGGFTAIGPLPAGVAEKVPRRERERMPVLPPEERKKNLLPYELGLDEAAALREAGRCLNCGLGAEVADEKCVSCLTCLRACPYGVPVMEGLYARMPVEGCQACGICASACPAGAINVSSTDKAAVPGAAGRIAEKGGVVLFACYSASAACPSLDNLGKGNGKAPPVRIVGLPTTGALRLEWILKAFEEGAAAVFVLGCKGSRCLPARGAAFVEGVIARARDLMNQIGIAPERLSYINPAKCEDLKELVEGAVGRFSGE